MIAECSNITFYSNLYILEKDFRINDKNFVSKIIDSNLLCKYEKQGVQLSKIQKQIIKESKICRDLEFADPCFGLKNGEYICRCVNKNCEKIDICRKGQPLTEEEFNLFTPNKNELDYDYSGFAVDYPQYSQEFNDKTDDNTYSKDFIVLRKDTRVAATHNVFTSNENVRIINEPFELDEIDENDIPENEEEYEEIDDEKYIENINELSAFKTVSQDYIIESPANNSFLVNAGPGTGKTYVLIQKIYNLVVKQGIEAEGIIVLSYTNAAVNEIKSRLNQFITKEKVHALNKVEVRTFDSFIANILCQLEENYKFNGMDYDRTRYDLISNLKQKPEWFNNITYLFVDEVQDLTDSLALFILEMIKNCEYYKIPYTLLGDSCQAIFDYEENNQSKIMTSNEFYQELLNICNSNINKVQLEGNKRQNDTLINLNNKYRELLLSQNKNLNKFIETEILSQKEIGDDCSQNSPKISFLTRQRVKALALASYLNKEIGIVNFITDKIDVDIAPWVAKVFNGKEFCNFSFEDFEKIINEKNICLPKNYALYSDKTYSTKSFWDYLLLITKSRNQYLDNQELLEKLYTKELDNPIFKFQNNAHMVVSTIHKAKGREFDTVILLSSDASSPKNNEVEQKVLYVALTRPKHNIIFTQNPNPINLYKNKNWPRIHKKVRKKLTDLEIKYKDIDILSLNQAYLIDINNKSKLNDEIYLYKRMDENSVYYDIIHCNHVDNKAYNIGRMTEDFSNTVKLYSGAKNAIEMPSKIVDLFINGEYSKIIENNDEYCIITVISFAGLGHMVYQSY